MSFALRAFAPQARQVALSTRPATALLQKRGMAGGEDDDDPTKVNWWDAPTKPDLWHKHHLAWMALAFWGAVVGTVSWSKSGKKTDATA